MRMGVTGKGVEGTFWGCVISVSLQGFGDTDAYVCQNSVSKHLGFVLYIVYEFYNWTKTYT